MFDSDDLQTRPYPALAPAGRPPAPAKVTSRLPETLGWVDRGSPFDELTVEDMEPPTRVLSTVLPVSAQTAFDAFCDSGRVHEWMAVVRSSRVIDRDASGRPHRTAFIARLERSSMGYTMCYEYDDNTYTVRWSNGQDTTTRISGSAHFTRLGIQTCMMHYELSVESDNALPPWRDPMYNGHPASSVLSDFRDFVSRNWE